MTAKAAAKLLTALAAQVRATALKMEKDRAPERARAALAEVAAILDDAVESVERPPGPPESTMKLGD